MKQRCPQCETWSAEDATHCSCGHQFGVATVARIHRHAAPRDDGRVRELQFASGKDLRNGIILIVLLTCLSVALFAIEMRPGLLTWVGLFWGVILIVRGLRIRREAWQLENLGFIERERNNAR